MRVAARGAASAIVEHEMPPRTTTLPQFQEYIWDQLPYQRGLLGREALCDVVAIAVQEWPDDELSDTKSGDTGEIKAQGQLTANIRRHLILTYGQEKFDAMWVIALQILLPIIIDQMLKWWRRRKENRGRIRIWRRKWTDG